MKSYGYVHRPTQFRDLTLGCVLVIERRDIRTHLLRTPSMYRDKSSRTRLQASSDVLIDDRKFPLLAPSDEGGPSLVNESNGAFS